MKKVDILPSSNHLKIEKFAFEYSDVKSISIQSKDVEIENGCFDHAEKLKEVIITPDSLNLKLLENDSIMTKSSQNNDNFDVIVFSKKDIEKIQIPINIEIIGKFLFAKCKKLYHIEFPLLSKLRIIDEYAFELSGINFIKI